MDSAKLANVIAGATLVLLVGGGIFGGGSIYNSILEGNKIGKEASAIAKSNGDKLASVSLELSLAKQERGSILLSSQDNAENIIALTDEIASVKVSVSALKDQMTEIDNARIGVIYDNGEELILKLPQEYGYKKVRIKYLQH